MEFGLEMTHLNINNLVGFFFYSHRSMTKVGKD